ncbi:glycerophosphodiester phosphodiesterase [Microbacterium sp. A196]|uniref:glycerophosphodiester phosphodiesterase n=1 Tax=Microbacterium sp. A196 TaxID=3457320 RepID=UPI003FD21B7A
MSVRRRRLWGAGAACATVCTLLTGFVSPVAHALASPPDAARHITGAATSSASLLDLVTLRPLAVLREPGQTAAIIGHRGDSAAAPENTMAAFELTTSVGAEYFEVDIRMSKDGVPVVMHDSTVDRTTDGTGAVADLTIAELEALDAGSWFDESHAGARIPALDDVLALVAGPHRTDVVIEYKGRWTKAGVRATIEMIDHAGLENRVIAQSFSEKTVAQLRKAAPDLVVGWLTHALDAQTISTARQIGADAVNPAVASARAVALAHDAGLGVFVWTHDADADWEELTAMGVDGIVTNRPDALQAWSHQRSADRRRPQGGARGLQF